MKIFLLGCYNNSEVLFGPEKVAKRIFNEFSKKNTDVTFIEYFLDGTKYGIREKLFGYEKYYNEYGKEILRLGIFRLIIELFKRKPKIIHIFNFDRFPLVAFLFRPFLNYKVYITIHGIASYEMEIAKKNMWNYYNLKDKVAEFLYYKLCDKLFFLSKESVEIASRYHNIKLSKVNFVANGIDEEFHSTFLYRHKVSGTKLKLVFIGDFNRIEKGLNFLLDCLSKIDFCLELFVIGLGYDNSSFNINENVAIHIINKIPTDQLAEFYKDKDIFISASFYEPFSLAVVEAMAAGLVPVVTEETGMSRFVKNEINGFKFKYGDEQSLLRLLKSLLSDASLLRRLPAKASEIYNQLCWQNISGEYKNIYMSHLNE